MTTHLKNAEGFIERLISDGEFRSRMEAHQSSAEAILAWANSEGYDLTPADVEKELKKRQETAATGTSLSDEELQTVNGGVLPMLVGYFAIGLTTGLVVGTLEKVAEKLDL